MSLGGILLCITGNESGSFHNIFLPMSLSSLISLFSLFLSYLKLPVQYSGSEAMFADLGHFSQLSIKVMFSVS